MNGRHHIRLVKRQVKALPTDWARDTSNAANSTDEEIVNQWRGLIDYEVTEAAGQWERRYPDAPIALITQDPSLSEGSRLDVNSRKDPDAFGGCAGSSDIPELSRQPDSGSTVSERSSDSTVRQSEESTLSTRSKAYKDYLLGRERHQIRLDLFDPSFVKLEINREQREQGDELLERGKRAYQSEEVVRLRREIANFNQEPDQRMERNGQREKGEETETGQAKPMTPKEKEQVLAKLQTRLLNTVSRAMVGDSYADLHHESGDHPMDHSRMRHANNFPKIRCDITTLKKGREFLDQSSEIAREVCATGASKIDRTQDRQRGKSDDLACYSVSRDIVQVQNLRR